MAAEEIINSCIVGTYMHVLKRMNGTDDDTFLKFNKAKKLKIGEKKVESVGYQMLWDAIIRTSNIYIRKGY